MVNYAQATGDVDRLGRLSKKCKNCDSGLRFIEDVYADGGQIRGGIATPTRFETSFINMRGEQWAVVDSALKLTPQVVDAAGSTKDARYPGGERSVRLYLEPDAETWTLRSLGTR